MAGFYDFHDEWLIKAALSQSWQAVSNPSEWQSWWPGLIGLSIIKQDQNLIGSIAQLTWSSRLGYKLNHTITITDFKPSELIKFTSVGDLEGYGSWRFSESNVNTQMTIDWHVITTKKWMNLLAPILRPVFRKNHTTLMKSGEAGLNKYLTGTL